MKKIFIGLMLLVIGIFLGSVLDVQKYGFLGWVGLEHLNEMGEEGGERAAQVGTKEKKILYWVAPMDPKYKRDKPGKSPMGMDLVPVYAGEGGGGDDSVVRISPSVVHNLGVRTATVQRQNLERRVDTVGYVGFDETQMSHVHLRTDGWVERLLVKSEGEFVKKGQLLFQYYSPTLVNAQEEFLQTLSSKHKRLVNASKLRLVSLGMRLDQVRRIKSKKKVFQLVSVYAPQHGIVSHLAIREGMWVKPAMDIMTLANLDSVWLQTAVFERQADWIVLGGRVEARLSYLPGEVWKGKVDFIYPTLDPKTRTLKVRLQFDTPNKHMKPNMYAKVAIFGTPMKNILTIPREAVIRSGRGERVIQALGEGRFKSRKIRVGMESMGWVEVLSGLQDGENVVTSAQFLIDSQASLQGSLDRMDAPQSEPPKEPMVPPKEPIAAPLYDGTGMLRQKMDDENKVKISHGPMPALKWPAMTMDFELAPGVNAMGVNVGQKVSFRLKKVGEFEYQLTEMKAFSLEVTP